MISRKESIKKAYLKYVTEKVFRKMLPHIDQNTGKFTKGDKEFLPIELNRLSSNNGWTKTEDYNSKVIEDNRQYFILTGTSTVNSVKGDYLKICLKSNQVPFTHFKPVEIDLPLY